MSSEDKPVAVGAERDSSTFTEIDDGQYCEFVGQLHVPSVVAFISVVKELRDFLELGQRVGFLPLGGDEDTQLSKLAALRDLLSETLPVVLRTDDRDFPIILPLDASQPQVKVTKFVGRATVYGWIIGRTVTGETTDVIQLPGASQVPQLNRQQRRAAERQGQSPAPSDMTVEGPAITLRVLAIEQ